MEECQVKKFTLTKISEIIIAVLFINLICSTNYEVSAYGTGAPYYACKTMKPCHGDRATGTDSIFSIEVSPQVITPSSKITVTLKAKTSKGFKGFLVSALKTTGSGSRMDNLIGTFHGPSNTKNTCEGKGLTHSGREPKTDIKFTWDPSGSISNSDKMVFNVTFLEEYEKYWMESSPEIACSSSNQPARPAAPEQPKSKSTENLTKWPQQVWSR